MKARLPEGMVTIQQFTDKHGHRLSFSYQTLYRRLLEWKDARKIKLFKFGKRYTIFSEERALVLWGELLTPVEIPPADCDDQMTLL